MKIVKRYAITLICCVCKKAITEGSAYWHWEHWDVDICMSCAPFETEEEAMGYEIPIIDMGDVLALLRRK